MSLHIKIIRVHHDFIKGNIYLMKKFLAVVFKIIVDRKKT